MKPGENQWSLKAQGREQENDLERGRSAIVDRAAVGVCGIARREKHALGTGPRERSMIEDGEGMRRAMLERAGAGRARDVRE